MVTDTTKSQQIGPYDVVRFVLELFAFISLGIWGFTAWPLPWPGVLIGIGAPALAVIVWGLFLSPRAVIRIDPFGKAVVEIAVMAAAALAWLDLGQPIVAIVFGVLATVSGVLSGRAQFR